MGLALLALGLGCEQAPATLRRDAGPRPDGGPRTAPDGGGSGADACEEQDEALHALLELGSTYDGTPTGEDVQRAAAELWQLEVEHEVTTQVVTGIERIVGDESDPVHDTPDGVAYLEGVIAEETGRAADLSARIDAARATAPDDVLREPDGAARVLDALMWAELSDVLMDTLRRCRDDRASIEAEEIETLVAGIARLVGDNDHGHGVARRSISTGILRAARGAP